MGQVLSIVYVEKILIIFLREILLSKILLIESLLQKNVTINIIANPIKDISKLLPSVE